MIETSAFKMKKRGKNALSRLEITPKSWLDVFDFEEVFYKTLALINYINYKNSGGIKTFLKYPYHMNTPL